MENTIMLHHHTEIFKSAIKETSNNLNIRDYFIEKDYWLSLVLKRLSESQYVDSVVFKGGTSLSKAYNLINRFSEDVDIAVINNPEWSGNIVKTLIRDVEKKVAADLKEEIVPEVSSKGSRFRKSVFSYSSVFKDITLGAISDKLIIEINSFANPYSYEKVAIQSMTGKFFQDHNQTQLVEKYQLQPFFLNVLDKRQTLLEKLISLIRFSFDTDPVQSIAGKIRHFYDLYYLLSDSICSDYIKRINFKEDFNKLLEHDKAIFNDPKDWVQKSIGESPLITNTDQLWSSLKVKYNTELPQIAYSSIPDETEVINSFKILLGKLL